MANETNATSSVVPQVTSAPESLSRRDLVTTLLGAGGVAALVGCNQSLDQSTGDLERVEGLAEALSSGTSGTAVRWFDTLTELRALKGGTTTTSLNVAIARGYAVPADGGGGIFAWTTDITSVDNGGTTIVPTGTRTGCWKRVHSGPINVKWFGALGNGSNDDGPAIKAALLAASGSLTGQAVYLPSGVYKVMQNLGLRAASGVVVMGDRMGEISVTSSNDFMSWAGGTVIWDGRKPMPTESGKGVDNFNGLLSFEWCNECGIRDLTLHGCRPASFDGAASSDQSWKGTHFSNSSKSFVERVRATALRDEAIYADGMSPDWHVSHCVIEKTNNYGINMNSGGGDGCSISFNRVNDSWGNAINVAGTTCVVHGNIVRMGVTAPVGADPIVIDSSSRAIVTDNLIHDSNISSATVCGINVFGSQSPLSSHIIANNVLVSITADWVYDLVHNHFGAGICLHDVAGTVLIANNLIDDCGATQAPAGGCAISIFGAATGKVHVVGNLIRNRSGKNITVGVNVANSVPPGAVSIGSNCYEGVATPYVLGQSSNFDGERRIVSTAGTTTLTAYDELVFVQVNGAVTITLPAANLYSRGRKRIIVKNTTTQTLTTLVNATSSNIDGSMSGSVSIVGPNASHTYESDGTNWAIVAKV